MGEIKEKPTAVVAQRDALKIYLDSMLFETITEDINDKSKVVDTITKVKLSADNEIENNGRKTILSDLTHKSKKVNDRVLSKGSNKSGFESRVKTDERHNSQSPIIPEYAKKNFTILTFKVAGVNLAVPLAEVASIEFLTDKMVPVSNKKKWIIGTNVYKRGSAFIIDTYELVIPEKRNENSSRPNYNASSKVLLSADGKWGLLCDEVGATIELTATDVCWRTMKTRRSWLAGTIANQACALIDFKKISWYE